MSACFRVLTLNVRNADAQDGPNRWEARRKRLIAGVRDLEPDIIGFQECLHRQTLELDAGLPEYGRVGVGRIDGKEAGEYVPIYYRLDRFRLHDSGHWWFSGTPEVAGSNCWGGACERMATWVRLEDSEAGSSLAVVNLHWDHVSEEARARSAGLLVERVEQLGGSAAVVVGDFNCEPESGPIRYLSGLASSPGVSSPPSPHWMDAWKSVHGDEEGGGTFHDFRGGTDGPRIDFIWVVGGLEVTGCELDTLSQISDRPISDHHGVCASLRWHLSV